MRGCSQTLYITSVCIHPPRGVKGFTAVGPRPRDCIIFPQGYAESEPFKHYGNFCGVFPGVDVRFRKSTHEKPLRSAGESIYIHTHTHTNTHTHTHTYIYWRGRLLLFLTRTRIAWDGERRLVRERGRDLVRLNVSCISSASV